MRPNRDALATAPKYRRLSAVSGGKPKVDRRGGFRKEGMIRGASVVTKGEALGHGFWLDDEFLESVHGGINRPNKGVKSRFTHPGMSSDGLATHLGRAMTGARLGEQVFADFHFTSSSHRAPDGGDLSGYVMDMAEESPEDIAVSIVFDPDFDAEREHFTAHGGKIIEDDFGEIWDESEFRSPDPLNTQDLPHARLADLLAADFVGDPAANPEGLFGREGVIVEEADSLVEYALGLSDRQPEAVSLGLDASRVRSFTQRFLANHKLEIRKMADTPNPITPAATVPNAAPAPVPAAPAAKPDEQQPTQPAAETPTEQTPELSKVRAEAKPYVDAFGQQGAVWFLEGKSLEECHALHAADQKISAVNDRLEKIEQRLSAGLLTGESSPIPFGSAETPKRQGLASRIRFSSAAGK